MKTLILYATKYGATQEIARRIANKMKAAEIYSLKQNDIPPLSQFDCVIIGSSLYAGMIRKEAKAFILQNAEALTKKKLGLFVSGLAEDRENTYFETNFSKEILQSAVAKSFLGGIFDPKKAGAIERLIIKVVAKQSGIVNNIIDEKITKFAETMKK